MFKIELCDASEASQELCLTTIERMQVENLDEKSFIKALNECGIFKVELTENNVSFEKINNSFYGELTIATYKPLNEILFYIKVEKMEESPMENKTITLNNIIRGNVNGMELSWQERVENFALIKKFLLTKCRKGSKMYNAVDYAWFENMEDFGIFNRVYVKNGIAGYIAGQDYTEEMKIVKKCFIK